MSQFLNSEKEKLSSIPQTQFNGSTNYFLTQISSDLSVDNLNVSNSINAPTATMTISNINSTGTINANAINAGTLNGGSIQAGAVDTSGGGLITVNGPSGVSRVYDPIYNPPPAPPLPAIGGWGEYFNEALNPIDLEAVGNTVLFSIPLPAPMQNATKYTIRVVDLNLSAIQGSTNSRALIFFDYKTNTVGPSYTGGGAIEQTGCDNNIIWRYIGNNADLQAGWQFKLTDTSTLTPNAPAPAPYSNSVYYNDAVAPSPGPPAYYPYCATLNLPVFNIYNINGDTGITNLYMIYQADPNDGSLPSGSLAAGARIRCYVEASLAPVYTIGV